jgi:hypothetical protein
MVELPLMFPVQPFHKYIPDSRQTRLHVCGLDIFLSFRLPKPADQSRAHLPPAIYATAVRIPGQARPIFLQNHYLLLPVQ